MPKREAQSLKTLHAGQRLLNDFNMFRLTEFYLLIVAKHDIRNLVTYRDFPDTILLCCQFNYVL
jgi:hypothetical protein